MLTSPIVRFYYKKLIEQFSADTVVLSFSEINSTSTFRRWEPFRVNMEGILGNVGELQEGADRRH